MVVQTLQHQVKDEKKETAEFKRQRKTSQMAEDSRYQEVTRADKKMAENF